MTRFAAPGWHARFLARFDMRLMTAPADDLAPPAQTCAGGQQLQLSLQFLADRSLPFASAHFPLHPSSEERARQLALLQHHMLELDGTRHMQSLGGPWRQRGHRLALKLQEATGRIGEAVQAWDCGFIRNHPDPAQALALFWPRRPTLVATWQLPSSVTETVLQSLRSRAPRYPHPVRLVICQAPQAPAQI